MQSPRNPDNPSSILVVGGANWDYLVRGPRLPRAGETVRGADFQEAPGGKGANQAVAAARLGARASLVARVGTDERGTAIIRSLHKEGVGVEHVLRDDSPTGIAVIQVGEDAEKQILTAPGANARLSVADINRARPKLEEAGVLLIQLEASIQVVAAAIDTAGETGATVVLDPAPAAPLDDEIISKVYLIRPNAEEAGVLTGIEVRDHGTAKAAAMALLERGVSVAVIQAGADGDLMVWRDGAQKGELWLPRAPVDSVDATGAGDAFAAALAVMVSESRPLEESGLFASAAAALTTTRIGAQAALPTRSEVEAFLASR